MKTFDEVKEMELTVFIVRQMVLLEEQEYHIRAERFTNTLINKEETQYTHSTLETMKLRTFTHHTTFATIEWMSNMIKLSNLG